MFVYDLTLTIKSTTEKDVIYENILKMKAV